MPRPVRCDECGSPHVGLQSRALMQMKVLGTWTLIWYCHACHAYVGCHEGTDVPFGTMADHHTRSARRSLHEVFDLLWRGGGLTRGSAYHWLGATLGLPPERAHISMLNEEQCGVAQEAAAKKLATRRASKSNKRDGRNWQHTHRKGRR